MNLFSIRIVSQIRNIGQITLIPSNDSPQIHFSWKTAGGEEASACFTPVWTWFNTLPTYGKFAFTDDKVLLTLPPRPFRTKIATTAMRAKISAYSTKLWPFLDFNPRYIFRRVLFIISFTSFIWLFRMLNDPTDSRSCYRLVAAYVPRLVVVAYEVVNVAITKSQHIAYKLFIRVMNSFCAIRCPVHLCALSSFLPRHLDMFRETVHLVNTFSGARCKT